MKNPPKKGPDPDGKVVILQPKFFPFSLEINQADNAVFDQANTDWVETLALFDNHQLSFTYTFKNKIPAKAGRIVGDIGGIILSPAPAGSNLVPALSADENFTAHFSTPMLPAGKYPIHLKYITEGFGLSQATHRFQAFDSTAADFEIDFIVSIPVVDKDQDKLDDRLEDKLLELFRPYFKYSKDEVNAPTDCIDYVKKVAGLADPFSILMTATNLGQVKKGGATCIGPDPQQTAFAKSIYAGAPWSEVTSSRNTGLYGHVVPVTLQNVDEYDVNHIPSGNDVGKTYYKVEYWQFYAYNVGCSSSAFDHQGDWTTVQVIVDPVNLQPLVVLHYAHGSIEARFRLDKPNHSEAVSSEQGEPFTKFTGENYNPNLLIDASNGKSIAGTFTYDNEVLFYTDPATGEKWHPVVYVEQGSHEFYPSKAWFISTCPNHNGDGPSFLAATPPNLGEMELPDTIATPHADLIMQFNGNWGCSAGAFNSPPPGPCLHSEWTYPASSSVRWLLGHLPM